MISKICVALPVLVFLNDGTGTVKAFTPYSSFQVGTPQRAQRITPSFVNLSMSSTDNTNTNREQELQEFDNLLEEGKLRSAHRYLKDHPSIQIVPSSSQDDGDHDDDDDDSTQKAVWKKIFDAIETRTRDAEENLASRNELAEYPPESPARTEMTQMYTLLQERGDLRLYGSSTPQMPAAAGSHVVTPTLLEQVTELPMTSLRPVPELKTVVDLASIWYVITSVVLTVSTPIFFFSPECSQHFGRVDLQLCILPYPFSSDIMKILVYLIDNACPNATIYTTIFEFTELPMTSLTPKPTNTLLIAGIAVAVLEGLISVNTGIDLNILVWTTITLAFLDKLLLNGALFESALKLVLPNIQQKITKHEAGHFLCAYLMGCPVEGCVLDAWGALQDSRFGGRNSVSAGTSFFDPTLSTQINSSVVTRSSIDRYSIIVMGGIAAEALNFGGADGGAGDEAALVAFLSQLNGKPTSGQLPPWNEISIKNQARWGALSAVLLLKEYRPAYDALVDALERGGNLGDCIYAIEKAGRDHNLKPLEKPLGFILDEGQYGEWTTELPPEEQENLVLGPYSTAIAQAEQEEQGGTTMTMKKVDTRPPEQIIQETEQTLQEYRKLMEEKLQSIDEKLKDMDTR
eukprot:CAMPEP_0195307710 /NCGR_PEP_ID=MMETSP0707-20130614/37855_1 /TAXON_ID=33640 /ORGANISM="Asterionellopsis glacialis, Strain CCMP134" /LENGTH=629 /DNA_ID=CAMNT_0040371963 /DNA_START=306 /DNA_END=2197 /DNA_ORIENTATION=+